MTNNINQNFGGSASVFTKVRQAVTGMGLKQAGGATLRFAYAAAGGDDPMISSIASKAIANTTIDVAYGGERGTTHIANILTKATIVSSAGYLAKETLNQVGEITESYMSSTPLGAVAGKVAKVAVVGGGAVLAGVVAGAVYDKGSVIIKTAASQFRESIYPSNRENSSNS